MEFIKSVRHWRIQGGQAANPQTSDEICCSAKNFRTNLPTSQVVIMQKGVQLQEGLRPLTTEKGLCPWTQWELCPPDSCYRFALRFHQCRPIGGVWSTLKPFSQILLAALNGWWERFVKMFNLQWKMKGAMDDESGIMMKMN